MKRFLCLIMALILFPVFSVSADGESFVMLYLGDNISVLNYAGDETQLSVYGVTGSGNHILLENSELIWQSSDNQIVRVDNGLVTAANEGSFAVISCSYENPDGTEALGSIVMHVVKTALMNVNMETYSVPSGKASYAKLSSDIVHSGEKSLNIFSGGGSYGRYDFYCTPGYCKSVREVWFYDDGETKPTGATVYFQDTKCLVALTVGAVSSNVSYYTYTNSASVRSKFGPGYVPVTDGSGYKGDRGTGNVTTGVRRTKGWHQVTYVVNPIGDYKTAMCTDNGRLTLYLDGKEIFTEKYLPERVHVIGLRSVNDASLYYDDIIMYNDTFNHPPEVESLNINGGFVSGEKLSADAVITDVEGDVIDSVMYSWKISPDKKMWYEISEEEYVFLDEFHVGNYIKLSVTPVSGDVEGEAKTVESEVKVAVNVRKPSVKDVRVSGNANAGEIFGAEYTFDGELKDASIVKWLVSDDKENWNERSEGSSFTVSAADSGKYLKAQVIPIDGYNLRGEAIFSETIKLDFADVAYFVSTDGSDRGTGSIDNPFASLSASLKAVEADRKAGFGGHINIYLREGRYFCDETAVLTKEHSNITISSYKAERAEMTGGIRVDKSRITTAEPEFSELVLDKTAGERLMKIDLSGLVNEIPGYGSFVHGSNKAAYNRFLQVYVDGVALDKSRWPNQRCDDLIMKNVEYDEESGDYIVTYNETEHPGKWSKRSLSETIVEGHFRITWSDAHAPLTGFDPTKRTFRINESYCYGNYRPDAEDEFYFHNIIEEIDLPGESWVDREKLAVYFYPPSGFDKDSLVEISLSETPVIEMSGASDITVSGIDFTYFRNRIFNVLNSSRIKFDGCRFMHFTEKNVLNGNGNAITNCYFYDGGQGGVTVSGGSGFTGGQSLVENNVFQSMDTLKMSYSAAITVNGYGHTIRKNEIYDSYHQVITLDGNDHLFEYNDIHHTTKWTGDMGAIYWLSGPASIGHEFRYNYFHDNGSDYYNGWSQAMFWDDCQVGPYIHHNVFARATSPYEDGINPSRRFALKANGGSYAYITNNIFVDCAYAAQFQNNERNVGINGNKFQQIDFWLRAYGKKADSNEAWFDKLKAGGYFTDAWKENYKDTVWEEYSNLFSLEFYEKNLAHLDKVEDNEELVEIARQYAPEKPNTFDKNVVFNTYKENAVSGGSNGVETNTVAVEKEDFCDYDGGDYSLSESGLLKVREAVGSFDNINMNEIGPDNKERITGSAPVALNPEISCSGWNLLEAEYEFSDEDGHHESSSEIKWYKSYTPDGEYEYTGHMGRKYISSDDGVYVKYSVTPRDEFGICGESVYSEPVFAAEGMGLQVLMFNENADGDTLRVSMTIENKSMSEKRALVIVYCTEGDAVKRLKDISCRIVDVPSGKISSVEIEVPCSEGAIKKTVVDLETLNCLRLDF